MKADADNISNLTAELEKLSGVRTRDQFDLFCGTSTGSIIAAGLAIADLPIEVCSRLYQVCSCCASQYSTVATYSPLAPPKKKTRRTRTSRRCSSAAG